MKDDKELNNTDLNRVSGGKNDLDNYLELLQKDGKKTLVDYDNETTLELDNDVKYHHDGNVDIVLRDKDLAGLPTEEIKVFLDGNNSIK